MRRSHLSKSAVALCLALAILIGVLPINIIALGGESDLSNDEQASGVEFCGCGLSLLYNGAYHKVITIAEDQKKILDLFILDDDVSAISWQILTPDGERWIDISGAGADYLPITYSLVGSMLNDAGSAFVRAEVQHGDALCVSEPVEVVVSFNSPELDAADSDAMLSASLCALEEGGENTDGGEGDEVYETFTIVINYIFDNGGLAFEPYGASVAKGSSFSVERTSPKVVGYKPVMRSGEGYVDATVVTLDYADVQSDMTVNVIYQPDIVKYQVHHHLQDLYDDDYSVTPDHITYGEGLTGSMVPRNVELDLPGFSHLEYEALEIAADGSTVVEIRYERNYYFIDFDMQGGWGVEPVYIRYGSELGANIPVRQGYVFEKWQLVEFDERAPTTQEASLYDINTSTITTPDADLTYRAVWITQLVGWTMVFWRENADDNGFSYWGSLDGLTAMSGSTVSGSDRIPEGLAEKLTAATEAVKQKLGGNSDMWFSGEESRVF